MMDGFGTGSSSQQTPRMEDLKQFGDNNTGSILFCFPSFYS